MMSLPDVLHGTIGWFLWNGSSLGREWPDALRGLIRSSGAQSIAIKTYDGNDAFSQPFTIADVKRELSDLGPVLVGAWGYHYGHDLAGEITQVEIALHRYQADYVILNVEDPAIELDPHSASKWATAFGGLRERWPNASLYFCSHAQPTYHTNQPYWQATVCGLVHQPMIYHTAMERPPAEAVDISVSQYDDYWLMGDPNVPPRLPWSAAGGCYDSGEWRIRPEDMLTWAERANAWGATSHVWWSLDWAMDRPDIIDAVRRTDRPPGKEKTDDCE